MKSLFPVFVFACAIACAGCVASDEGDAATLCFDRPAAIWEETLPLGNGRLSMMPDGGIARERVVLDEESMWSGCEHDTRNPGALAALPAIRQLLLEGRNAEAQALMYERFTCSRDSNDPAYGSYETLGSLVLEFPGIDTAAVDDYRRELSLRDAVATTRFRSGGTTYGRRYFVSRADDVAVVELTADRPGAIDVAVALSRPERGAAHGAGDLRTIGGPLGHGAPAGWGGAARGRERSERRARDISSRMPPFCRKSLLARLISLIRSVIS